MFALRNLSALGKNGLHERPSYGARSAFALVLAVSAVGCGSSLSDEHRAQSEPQGAGNGPVAFVDADGNEWISNGAAVVASDAELPDLNVRKTAHNELDLYSLSEAELAEALRPIALSNGIEYTSKPNLELARRVLASKDVAFTGKPSEGSARAPAQSTAAPPRRALATHIIGNDDRYPLPYNTTWPYRTIAEMWEGSDANHLVQNCTLTLIGASTAITAAHCFHTGSKWRPTHAWAFGARSTQQPKFPYNPWDASYPTTIADTGPVFGCYTVTVPGCWTGYHENCDYAVVEFSSNGGAFGNCDLHPGSTLGWMGWGQQPKATVCNAEHDMKGYPADPCLGGSCQAPLLWGEIQPQYQTCWGAANGYSQIAHHFDSSGGDSGATLVNTAEGFAKSIGIHWGGYAEIPSANYAVKIDSTVIGFVQQYSAQ